MTTQLVLRTFGQLELYRDSLDPEPFLLAVKPLLLPALLATRPNLSADRTYLAELIWHDSGAGKARASLRQALHHLTRAADGGGLVASGDTVRLDPSLISVDWLDFDEAFRGGDYERVISLYRGPFLQSMVSKVGPELQRDVEAQNDRVNVALNVAFTRIVDARLGAGAVDEAVGFAYQYASLNPLSELAQLTLIRTLRTAGKPGRAVQAFEGFRSLLKSELGGELDEEVQEGLEELRREAMRPPEPRAVLVGPGPHGGRRAVGAVWLSTASLGFALAVLSVFLTFSVFDVFSPFEDPRGAFDDIDATVGVQLGDRAVDLVFDGRRARLDQSNERPDDEVVSPDGMRRLARVDGQSGRDLAIRDLASGGLELVSSDAADQYPITWSPDGRRALVARVVEADGGRSSRLAPRVLRLDGGMSLALPMVIDVDERENSWSPMGLYLGLTHGRVHQSVQVVTVDGQVIADLQEPSVSYHSPSWSPDDRSFAFEFIDVDELGEFGLSGAIGIADIGGKGFDTLDVDFRATNPVFVAQNVLAVVERGEVESRVWLVEIAGGERVLAWSGPRNLRLRVNEVRLGRAWLDSIQSQPGLDVVSPGQHLDLTATWRSSNGSVMDPTVPTRWSGSADVFQVGSGGSVVVTGLGRGTIIGDVAGWRSHVLELTSLPVGRVRLPLLFTDNWTDSIRSERWTSFGAPSPYASIDSGPEQGGYLVTNGDAAWTSGVLSTQAFPTVGGVTAEVWIEAPLTGRHNQDWVIAFTDAELPADPVQAATWEPPLALSFDGHGRSGAARVGQHPIPGAATQPGWFQAAIQLSPEGEASVVQEGRILWRGGIEQSSVRSSGDQELPKRVRLYLAGQSAGTRIRHGPVTVYEGVRYVPQAVDTSVRPLTSGG